MRSSAMSWTTPTQRKTTPVQRRTVPQSPGTPSSLPPPQTTLLVKQTLTSSPLTVGHSAPVNMKTQVLQKFQNPWAFSFQEPWDFHFPEVWISVSSSHPASPLQRCSQQPAVSVWGQTLPAPCWRRRKRIMTGVWFCFYSFSFVSQINFTLRAYLF